MKHNELYSCSVLVLKETIQNWLCGCLQKRKTVAMPGNYIHIKIILFRYKSSAIIQITYINKAKYLSEILWFRYDFAQFTN